jgi:predicted O-methyltransferase YrrM
MSVDAAIDELDELRTSRDDAWQIPRVEGELLRQIALASHAKIIVEIGTSYGFSGLFWLGALRHTAGHLHTIDKDPRKFESARATFARAGVGDRVTCYLGDAKQILPQMPDGIDIAFIDADKPACREYFDVLLPKLRVGGSILTDNATTHRDELHEFTAYVRSMPNVQSTIVAVGNGVEWTIKLR